MALKEGFPGESEGRITQAGRSRRTYRVGEPASFIDYLEKNISITTVWTGLTKDAAFAQVVLSPQPTTPDSVNSWTYDLESPMTGSYTVQRVFNQKITEVV